MTVSDRPQPVPQGVAAGKGLASRGAGSAALFRIQRICRLRSEVMYFRQPTPRLHRKARRYREALCPQGFRSPQWRHR